MYSDYQFANLSAEDRQRVQALERELGERYRREVVLIAYEKPGASGNSADMEVGAFGTDATQRGSTFGFSNAHGDHFPTLGSLKYGRTAEGEDLRFSDAEPPNREAPPTPPKRRHGRHQ